MFVTFDPGAQEIDVENRVISIILCDLLEEFLVDINNSIKLYLTKIKKMK